MVWRAEWNVCVLLLVVPGCFAPTSGATSEGKQPDRQSTESTPESPAVAKAVPAETEHDFGILEDVGDCTHAFMIRNEGSAPLKLEPGGSTCFCTVSQVPTEPILPGDEAPLQVVTQLKGKEGFFAQVASVTTNDPEQPTLSFKVFGSIRTHLGVWPDQVVFSGGDLGGAQTAEVTVYSQVWDKFTLEEPQSSLKGLTWKISSASETQLSEVQAKSGYRVEITAPQPAPPGDYWETLEFACKASDDTSAEPRKTSVEITGAEPVRFTLDGARFDRIIKYLRLSLVPQDRGTSSVLTLKFRDQHRNVAISGVEVTHETLDSGNIKKVPIDPGVLQVGVSHFNPGNPDLGLYRIDVEVPAGAPEANHMGVRRAEVSIATDHPHVPVVTFYVEFAVTRS